MLGYFVEAVLALAICIFCLLRRWHASSSWSADPNGRERGSADSASLRDNDESLTMIDGGGRRPFTFGFFHPYW